MSGGLIPVQGNPFVLATGAQPTPQQAQAAAALQGFRDPNAPAGSPQNPSYDTPDRQGGDDIVHVDMQGQTHVPAGLVPVNINPYSEARVPWGEDVARTIPGAAVRAGTGMLGIVGDMRNAVGNGEQWLLTKGASALQDAFNNDLGMPHHPRYIPTDFAAINHDVTSDHLNRDIEKVTGPFHRPQTAPAKFVDTAIQMAPAAFGGEGGLLVRGARVLAPTIGTEAAGAMAQGTKYEPMARVLGALAGGSLGGMGEGMLNAPRIASSRYFADYTPAQIQAAEAFRAQQLANHGISLTPMEALVQTAGGKANQLQHYAENSASVGPQLAMHFDQRPGQVRGAIDQMADLIAPPPARGPYMLGQAAQGEAEGALAGVRREINAAAEPHYAAIKGQEMDPSAYQALMGDPSWARAVADFRGNPEISHAYRNLPDNNLSVINEVQKQADANARAAAPGEFNPQGNHQLEAARQNASQLAGLMARAASDANYGGEYGAARDTVAQGIADRLDPLRAGPLGAVSQTPDVNLHTEALYPAAPNVGGTPALIAALERLPETGGQLTRQHVVDTADRALADTQYGPNQWGGAKFARAIAGSQEQQGRLLAGVNQVAGPDQAAQLADMLEGLRATGKRMNAGSLTNLNRETAEAMGATPSIAKAGKVLDPLEWGQLLDKSIGGALYRNRMQQLADLIMSQPDAATTQELLRIQRAARPSGDAAMRLLFDASGARQ